MVTLFLWNETPIDDTYVGATLLIIILGIIKVAPANQQLYYENEIMDETKTLSECGLNSITAENPATIGLTLK